ncbi:MAG: Rv3654c family TadE-like protein [Microbacteriaceae bacterium]
MASCWWPGSARNRLCCRGSPSPPRLSRWRSRVAEETGSASLIAVALIALLLAVTAGLAVLGSVVIARHRAQSAADLAALSAAVWLTSGPQAACARAVSVAAAVRTEVTDCSVQGLDAVVTVEADAGVPGWRASARARAGPAESGG